MFDKHSLSYFVKYLIKYPTELGIDLVLLFVALIGWWHLSKLTTSGRIVLLFLSLSFSLSVATWVAFFQGLNNHYLFTLQALVEFVSFGSFYLIETKSRPIRWGIGAVMAGYLLTFGIMFDSGGWNDLLVGMARLVEIGFVLAYFWSLLSDMLVGSLLRYPPFWVSIAVLLNGAGTVFIFLFNRMTLTSSSDNSYYAWYRGVTLGFMALFYLLLAYSFWLSRPMSVLSASEENV
jgi:hypothetical protein